MKGKQDESSIQWQCRIGEWTRKAFACTSTYRLVVVCAAFKRGCIPRVLSVVYLAQFITQPFAMQIFTATLCFFLLFFYYFYTRCERKLYFFFPVLFHSKRPCICKLANKKKNLRKQWRSIKGGRTIYSYTFVIRSLQGRLTKQASVQSCSMCARSTYIYSDEQTDV